MGRGGLGLLAACLLAGCGLDPGKTAAETGVDTATSATCSPDECVGTCCDGVCVDTFSDPDNCGACGITCLAENASTTCDVGSCALDVCDDGWGDCDGDEATGCEAEVACDPGAACRTECGSVGATWCGDPCAPTCLTIDETCNGLDDDCDGGCDEGALPGCRGGVYRSRGALGHLYGRDQGEVADLGQTMESAEYFFVYESEAVDLVPLYRCIKSNGRRLLTRSATCEGGGDPEMLVGYVAAVERCGATPLYRLYSASGQNHFYTLSPSERDNAVNALGYAYESIAAWVWTGP